MGEPIRARLLISDISWNLPRHRVLSWSYGSFGRLDIMGEQTDEGDVLEGGLLGALEEGYVWRECWLPYSAPAFAQGLFKGRINSAVLSHCHSCPTCSREMLENLGSTDSNKSVCLCRVVAKPGIKYSLS